MTGVNPTLLIGLGAFGRAVARALDPAPGPGAGPASGSASGPVSGPASGSAPGPAFRPGDPRRGPAVLIADEPDLVRDPRALADELTGRACELGRELLELGYFVDTTAPTDARGPRLDVFIIGDVADARVARLAPILTGALARALRARFRPILGAGQGHLAVCPMLVASRSSPGADRPAMAACIRALAALARAPDVAARPRGRIYIIEDQSGKYLLPAAELERSFTAFLSLLFDSRLRDGPGVRELVEDPGDDRAGPLATFACATLEIDIALLHELCAHRLARDMLAHYHAGELTLAEIAGEAHPLLPERTALEAQLWQEGKDGSLEDYLEPPHLSVPEIRWSDSPEDIVERKFGPGWRLETEHIIDDFRDQVERFKMDRLAKRIEDNGTALLCACERGLMARIREIALASPRGPGRALEFARYAATRARGFKEQSRRAIDSPSLRELPESPLGPGLSALEDAARAWPRHAPARMRFFGFLAVLVGAFAAGGLTHLILDMAMGAPHWLLSGAVGAALAASSVRYNLWAHRKRHHNWLVEARHDLDQSLERHLREDLVAYFRARLAYTRDLFTFRIYRALEEKLDAVVVQLEGARAAVAEAMRHADARRHDLEQRRLGRESDGILYRSVLAPEVVDAVYEFTRPPDLAAVAARYHAFATRGQETGTPASGPGRSQPAAPVDVLEAPYADSERVWAFAYREFAHLEETTPYEQADTPLYHAVVAAVRRYLGQLALKLSPPLEVLEMHAGDAPAERCTVIAPPEARALVERMLADENLDRGWQVRPNSSDVRRLHLLLERGRLPVAAVALAQVEPDDDTARAGGGGVP